MDNYKPFPVDYMFTPTVSCIAPPVPTNAHISFQSYSVYIEGANITFQCDNASLTSVCHASGNWTPPPSELDCSPRLGNHLTQSDMPE